MSLDAIRDYCRGIEPYNEYLSRAIELEFKYPNEGEGKRYLKNRITDELNKNLRDPHRGIESLWFQICNNEINNYDFNALIQQEIEKNKSKYGKENLEK